MEYTIHKLAESAGVSVRTLHFYDTEGVLKPLRIGSNGYRYYGEQERLRLQQILFFRELEFPLDEIKAILDAPDFDMAEALKDQHRLLGLKRTRLGRLMKTIDETITSIKKKKTMSDSDLYGSFTKEEMEKYQEEARQKWGDTKAYKQSAERVKKMSKGDLAAIQKENEEVNRGLAAAMDKGAKSKEAQAAIARHHAGIERFYTCSPAMYRNLGKMYVDDPRFTAHYEKYRPGLAIFVRDAIVYFCDREEGKGK